MALGERPEPPGWRTLLRREWIPSLAVLLGGILLPRAPARMLYTARLRCDIGNRNRPRAARVEVARSEQGEKADGEAF